MRDRKIKIKCYTHNSKDTFNYGVRVFIHLKNIPKEILNIENKKKKLNSTSFGLPTDLHIVRFTLL